VAKPDVAFFDKLVALSGHERGEIAYVGDRLDYDIAPAAGAGLVTVWMRRGPWGYVLRPRELMVDGSLPENAPTLTIMTLTDLVTHLNAGWIADTNILAWCVAYSPHRDQICGSAYGRPVMSGVVSGLRVR
jgi:hypothetical protein